MKNIVAIILIIAAIGLYVLYINPTYDTVKELRADAAKFDEALDRSRELLDTRDELLSRYNSFSRENIDRLEKILPDTVDNVRLIIDIDNIADRYGMVIKNVSIATESQSETTGAFDGDIVDEDSGTKASLKLGFTVATSYNTFQRFLMDLEDSLRILDVRSISFTSPNEADGESLYSITIETYWLK